MQTRGYSGGGQRLRDKSNQRMTHRWNNHVTCPEMDFVIGHRSHSLTSCTVHISTECWPLHRPYQHRYTGHVLLDTVCHHPACDISWQWPLRVASQAVPQAQSIPEEKMQYGHESMPVHRSRLLMLTCLSTSFIFVAVNMHPNITICCTSCLRVQLPNILMLNIALEC